MFDMMTVGETGWSQRELDRFLDSPDEHGPSQHWRNPLGEPLYDRTRIAVARWRAGEGRKPKLSAQQLDWWLRRSPQPTCAPVLVVNFHALADAHRQGVKKELWGERLSHPVAGRFPGSNTREEVILKDCMVRLVAAAEGRPVESWDSAQQLLAARAPAALQRLGTPWPHVVIRRARRSTYIPRGAGAKTVARAIDALAVAHAGLVKPCAAYEEIRDVIDLLVKFPVLRFDPLSAT